MLGAAAERAAVMAAAKAHQERLDNDKKLCWKARALAVDQRALLCVAVLWYYDAR